MGKKQKGSKRTYGEKILGSVGKAWRSTGDIISSVKCPARAARRVLRGLVRSKQLKSVKVARERYFAKPGTKSAPPKAESGNGRSRSRNRKAKKTGSGKGSKKSKRRRVRVNAHQRQRSSAPVKKRTGKRASVRTAKPERKRSGPSGTPTSAPDSVAEIQEVATRTTGESLLS